MGTGNISARMITKKRETGCMVKSMSGKIDVSAKLLKGRGPGCCQEAPGRLGIQLLTCFRRN
ncbi:MAG: hypothetical protein ACTHKA_11840 [Anaerocolumna jejuensis]